MKHSLTLACLILSTLCLNAEENSSLSSLAASYNGNTLVLKGNVTLDHALGKLYAEEALLDKHEAGKEFPFAQIKLKKGVNIVLSKESSLTCDEADLDFTSFQGDLKSSASLPIVFKDFVKNKKNQVSPFTLKSSAAHLVFSKDSAPSAYEIDHLFAKDLVEIDYLTDFHLTADQASYNRALHGSSKKMQGVLQAQKKVDGSKCVLTHKGDEIYCDAVEADTIQSRLTMHNAEGFLKSSFLAQANIDELHFNSNILDWDVDQNTLKLKGSVEVRDPAIGILTCEEEVILHETLKDSKRFVDKIRSQGFTTLNYYDIDTEKNHKLVSHGSLELDRIKLKGKARKPANLDVYDEGKQIYYEEENYTITADDADFDYSVAGNTIQPTLMRLKGSVKISSHDAEKPPKCGVCDQLTYSPSTRTIIMIAEPGKKVLFWDDEQNARISAREVHIIQDPNTKKETIRGVGQVQFSFTPQEQSLLEKIFPYLAE